MLLNTTRHAIKADVLYQLQRQVRRECLAGVVNVQRTVVQPKMGLSRWLVQFSAPALAEQASQDWRRRREEQLLAIAQRRRGRVTDGQRRLLLPPAALVSATFAQRDAETRAYWQPSDRDHAVMLRNLPRNMNEASLRSLFSDGYDIQCVRLSASEDASVEARASDSLPPTSRGIACVVFRDEDDMWRALAEKQGLVFGARRIELSTVE